ncbi:hypothetical protein BYT27DRAFT_7252438 [Phlegmacium glaucopus]|nr:hypothetical protein BYT27DRAFT_7252438 [Phlegmacium glaucopus]
MQLLRLKLSLRFLSARPYIRPVTAVGTGRSTVINVAHIGHSPASNILTSVLSLHHILEVAAAAIATPTLPRVLFDSVLTFPLFLEEQHPSLFQQPTPPKQLSQTTPQVKQHDLALVGTTVCDTVERKHLLAEEQTEHSPKQAAPLLYP